MGDFTWGDVIDVSHIPARNMNTLRAIVSLKVSYN
jgi:hypothetical protein